MKVQNNFDKCADRWSTTRETPWNKLRYELTNEFILSALADRPKSVLNIGCGDGIESYLFDSPNILGKENLIKMDSKILTGISLGFLFLAFMLISCLVVITKRHPFFVAKKLRIGALILSISGAAAVGCSEPTCYFPPIENKIKVDQANTDRNSITINKAVSDTITGHISNRFANTFSFTIVDSSDKIVLTDDIQPADGSFDENFEVFIIILGQSILPGKYDLNFFSTPKDSIHIRSRFEISYSLTIIE